MHQNNKNEHVLRLTIDGKHYDWHQQYITGAEIKQKADIPSDFQVYLTIKEPWKDELIADNDTVDLARPGIEHFYSKKKEDHAFVAIRVNDIERSILRGSQTVADIKKVGDVPSPHELEQLIHGKLTPLEDNASVVIKGGEEFFSHVRDGASS